MKNIQVFLKIEDDRINIGEINLNPHVGNAVFYSFKEYVSTDNITVYQVGKLGIEGEDYAYLYQVYDGQSVSYYYVECGYLYDQQTSEYFTEIEVGEKMLSDDLVKNYRAFVDKVCQRWE